MRAGSRSSIDNYWKQLRNLQPNGPLVNVEYYPGWLSHWQESLARVPSVPVIESFRYFCEPTFNACKSLRILYHLKNGYKFLHTDI